MGMMPAHSIGADGVIAVRRQHELLAGLRNPTLAIFDLEQVLTTGGFDGSHSVSIPERLRDVEGSSIWPKQAPRPAVLPLDDLNGLDFRFLRLPPHHGKQELVSLSASGQDFHVIADPAPTILQTPIIGQR